MSALHIINIFKIITFSPTVVSFRIEIFSKVQSTVRDNACLLFSSNSLCDHVTRAKNQHESEFLAGKTIFGLNLPQTIKEGHTKIWSDDDFIVRSVGLGNGGPTESVLRNGHNVYETKDVVMDGLRCDYFIRAARETIEREERAEKRHCVVRDKEDRRRTNSELGEARLSKLPSEAIKELRSLLQEQLYPLLMNRFGIEDMTMYDGLILSNIGAAKSQPVHRDASLLTLNIALSSTDDYVGGGTYFEALENHNGLPLRVHKGHLLCHSSGVMHAGTGISSGERWVMVIFVISKNELQIARRVHAYGLEFIESKSLNDAKLAFEAGLNAAPNDHLLHMGLGRIASMRGEDEESFQRLIKSSSLYPASHTAAMVAGKMLEEQRKHLEALQYFDQVISHIGNKDLIDGSWLPLKAVGWNARVSAARCALICAEQEVEQCDLSTPERTWTKRYLPEAIDRLRTALIPVPENEYIQSMLGRAVELLTAANEKAD